MDKTDLVERLDRLFRNYHTYRITIKERTQINQLKNWVDIFPDFLEFNDCLLQAVTDGLKTIIENNDRLKDFNPASYLMPRYHRPELNENIVINTGNIIRQKLAENLAKLQKLTEKCATPETKTLYRTYRLVLDNIPAGMFGGNFGVVVELLRSVHKTVDHVHAAYLKPYKEFQEVAEKYVAAAKDIEQVLENQQYITKLNRDDKTNVRNRVRELLEWSVNSEYTEALEKILQQLGTNNFDSDEMSDDSNSKTNRFGDGNDMDTTTVNTTTVNNRIYPGYKMLKLLKKNANTINDMLNSGVCSNKKRKMMH